MIVSKIGLLPTFNIGFGVCSVNGLSLVPKPPAISTTRFVFRDGFKSSLTSFISISMPFLSIIGI